MSENKKYYYMRLNENYFDSDAQILLENMPDGYLYSNILLKLYLKSLKNDGKLMFNDRIPYSPQMIATITRHQIGTVEKALQIFKELNIIDVIDTGAIYMLDIQNYIGKSNTEADRKRAYRKKIEEEKSAVGHLSSNCPLEIDIDIEKDIDIKKEINIKKEKKKTDAKTHYAEFVTMTSEEYDKLVSTYGTEFVKQCISVLDNYKGANGKKYNSDYRAILSWVVGRVKKECKQPIRPIKEYEKNGKALLKELLQNEEDYISAGN